MTHIDKIHMFIDDTTPEETISDIRDRYRAALAGHIDLNNRIALLKVYRDDCYRIMQEALEDARDNGIDVDVITC